MGRCHLFTFLLFYFFTYLFIQPTKPFKGVHLTRGQIVLDILRIYDLLGPFQHGLHDVGHVGAVPKMTGSAEELVYKVAQFHVSLDHRADIQGGILEKGKALRLAPGRT